MNAHSAAVSANTAADRARFEIAKVSTAIAVS